FGIGIVEEKAIDSINIFEASRRAMKEAIAALIGKLGPKKGKRRTHIIVDGNMRLDAGLPCLDIINGDSKSKSIAAASILAKVIRDRIMFLYDRIYPEYGFLQHKGYPTSMHRDTVRRFGPSLIHRTTFCCG
ncbi:MAG TPA: ribonuclease HII, partial [Candidatus Omnitrophota bacterium]|nr:ribonuclease HII [Candidatus Omnitrophota bacterium]